MYKRCQRTMTNNTFADSESEVNLKTCFQASNRQKDMDLSKDYVTEWRTYIAEPMQREVMSATKP